VSVNITLVRALVHHIGLLRRQHRAGINEQSGQLDALFELTDVVDRELAHAEVTARPPVREPDEALVQRVVDEVLEDMRVAARRMVRTALERQGASRAVVQEIRPGRA
jgi:hypothetical protein